MIEANQKSLLIRHSYIRLHSSHALWCMAAFILSRKAQIQMKLVLAEKPSIDQSIAKVLGATKHEDGYLQDNGNIVS